MVLLQADFVPWARTNGFHLSKFSKSPLARFAHTLSSKRRTAFNILLALGCTAVAFFSSEGKATQQPQCSASGGFSAVDLSYHVTSKLLDTMKSIGVKTIIRYYDWDVPTVSPEKPLTVTELDMILRNDFSIAVVFQHNSGSPGIYIPGRGTKDALVTLDRAKTFGQPAGSAIYFGTDGADERFFENYRKGKKKADDPYGLKRITEYFAEIRTKLNGTGYDVGVYGSGKVCEALFEAKLVKYCWLANAMGWPGSREFAKSERWALKQSLPIDCDGKEDVDLNVTNPTIPDFGQWRKRSP